MQKEQNEQLQDENQKYKSIIANVLGNNVLRFYESKILLMMKMRIIQIMGLQQPQITYNRNYSLEINKDTNFEDIKNHFKPIVI